MYLLDTNIFLEILLKQEKSEFCKNFLINNSEKIHISDFTLHSIGVILFRQKKEEIFERFIIDLLPKVILITLPKDKYQNIIEHKHSYNLDFDDSYQYSICKNYDLEFVTMDQDFKNIRDAKIYFL